MTAPLVDRNTGDVIPASDHNDVKDYIEDGAYRVNTSALSINGSSVIDITQNGSFLGSVTTSRIISSGSVTATYGSYSGNLVSLNLSGTNTGDQTLAGLNGLPQGVIPLGSLTLVLPQGVLPVGSLSNALPQGLLPIGSIPQTSITSLGNITVGSWGVANLDAGSISAGTLSDSRLPTSMAGKTFSSDILGSGTIAVNGSFTGSFVANRFITIGSYLGGYGSYSGNIVALNLSGTNTGDQTLAGLNGLPQGVIPLGSLTLVLPQGVLPAGSLTNALPQGQVPVGSLAAVLPQGILPIGSIPQTSITSLGNITVGSWGVANLNAGSINSGTLSDSRLPSSMTGKTFTTDILGSGGVVNGSFTGSLTASNFTTSGSVASGYGSFTGNLISLNLSGTNTGDQTLASLNGLPQGVIPLGSLTLVLPQGVLPVGSLTNALPHGVLPVGSIPTLTAYIPQGQLITGSLPNTISISGSVVAAYGSFSGNFVAGSYSGYGGNLTGISSSGGGGVGSGTVGVTGSIAVWTNAGSVEARQGSIDSNGNAIVVGSLVAGSLFSSGNIVATGSFFGYGGGISGVTASASPAGSGTNIQYNDGAATAGTGSLAWDQTNSYLQISKATAGPEVHLIDVGDSKTWKLQNASSGNEFRIVTPNSATVLAFNSSSDTATTVNQRAEGKYNGAVPFIAYGAAGQTANLWEVRATNGGTLLNSIGSNGLMSFRDYNTINGSQYTPQASSGSYISLYNRSWANRQLLSAIGPNGIDYPLQPHVGFSRIAMWEPASAAVAGTSVGWGFTTAPNATASHPTLASTNLSTAMYRTRFASAGVIGSAGGIFAVNNTQSVWLGNAAGLGGFFFSARFLNSTGPTAGTRAFVGLSGSGVQMLSGSLVNARNIIGVGYDNAESTTGSWNLYYAGTGAQTVLPLNSHAARGTGSTFDLLMFSAPNSGSVWITFRNIVTGSYILHNYPLVSSGLPATTTFLGVHAYAGCGGTTTAQNFELATLYLESDI